MFSPLLRTKREPLVGVNTVLSSQTSHGVFPQALIHLLAALLSTVYLISATNTRADSAPLALTELDLQKVIEINGSELGDVLGESINRLSLEVFKNGKFYSIPSQIDEFDEEGGVYFKKSKIPLDGAPGIVDVNDKLYFMLKDTGDKYTGEAASGGTLIKELELTTDHGVKRYAYLVKDSKLKTDVTHVRFSNELGLLETDYYSITVNPKNALNWDDFQYFDYEGDQDSPLDTMKLRFKAGIISKFAKVTLTNKHLVAKPIAEQIGPIRATAHFKVTVFVFKLPVMKAQVQAHYLPHGFEYTVRLKIPRVRRKLLRDPSLSISFDGNQLNGAEMTTALGSTNNLSAKVDGRQSLDEIGLIEAGVTKEDNWIWVQTHNNMDWVSFVEMPIDSEEEIDFFVVDDPMEKDAPERFLGQSPNIGYKFTEIPVKGWVRMKIKVFMSKKFEASHLAGEMTQIRSQPTLKVNSALSL